MASANEANRGLRLHTSDLPVGLGEQLDMLYEAITNKPPYCSGTIKVKEQDLILYYGKDRNSKRIDFLRNSSEDDLRDLCEACERATFGLNQVDVLDETYRKALKMDSSDFATKFDVMQSGLIQAVRDDLLDGTNSSRPIRAELYKLNVYGPGSFFKKHKDTPHSTSLFGSLVIVFPVAHKGGSLTFSIGEEKWTFDSAIALENRTEPSIAYAAFFSDVDHEVMPVVSGYRVTLTYNLYYGESFDPSQSSDRSEEVTNPIRCPDVPKNEITFFNVFKSLLEDPSFLPEGGHLGFGLRHQYPFDCDLSSFISNLEHRAKGSDAIIYRNCLKLKLGISFQVLYEHEKDVMIINSDCSWEDAVVWEGASLWDELGARGAQLIEAGTQTKEEPDLKVHWITDVTRFNAHRLPFIAYGNEAERDYVYGDICLIVKVPSFSERKRN